MNWLGELARRLKMLILRRQFDADLEEEMRLHLELRQQEQLQAGMAAEDANAAARRRFGNTTYLKEESRIAWGWGSSENVMQDALHGLRVLRKSPGFAAIAVLTIALGIGATTAIFSVVHAVLLQPLPFPEPHRLVRVFDDLNAAGAKILLPSTRFSASTMRPLSSPKTIIWLLSQYLPPPRPVPDRY
jgi:hypothetical protein